MTKKNILVASIVYIVYFIAILIIDRLCHNSWCRIHDEDFLGWVFIIFLPLLPIFFLSLITYRMKDEIFRAWWNFARWWVLVIIVGTLFLNMAGSGGGLGIGGAISSGFNILVLSIFYAILIIGSLVKIVKKHRELKQRK